MDPCVCMAESLRYSPETITKVLIGWGSGKESTYYCRRRRCRLNPWVRKIPWRRKWQPTPVFLPGETHGQRSLMGYSPWGRKRVGPDLVTTQHLLTNSVVIVSGEQQRDSATPVRASILPQNPLPSRLLHNIEQSSLC